MALFQYIPQQAQAFNDTDSLRRFTEEEFHRLAQLLQQDSQLLQQDSQSLQQDIQSLQQDIQLLQQNIQSIRDPLTAARTYFVDAAAGSDTNDGVIAPFKTVQGALDKLSRSLDLQGYGLTIQLAPGSYAGGLVLPPFVGATSNSPIIIQGNVGNPSAATLTYAGGGNNVFGAGLGNTFYIFNGLGFNTSGGANAFYIVRGSYVSVSNCNFIQNTLAILRCEYNATISVEGPLSVQGSTDAVFLALRYGLLITSSVAITSPAALTLSGQYAYAELGSQISAGGLTFPGAGNVTGRRYASFNNSIINTNGGGANYFPGTIAGVLGPGGLYL